MGYALPWLQLSELTALGAAAIYLSTLTLIVLVVSMIGITDFTRLGYMGVFLACMGTASILYFMYGVSVFPSLFPVPSFLSMRVIFSVPTDSCVRVRVRVSCLCPFHFCVLHAHASVCARASVRVCCARWCVHSARE